MKTPLMYGALMAVAGALVTFGLYFAGLHDTADKLSIAQQIGLWSGLVITIGGIALAIRERRAEHPADREWGYGTSFGTGFFAGAIAVAIGSIVSYVYMDIINPQFQDLAAQVQAAKLEQGGVPAAQIEQQVAILHKPLLLAIFQLIGGILFTTITSLIVAIFFRRRSAITAFSELPPTIV